MPVVRLVNRPEQPVGPRKRMDAGELLGGEDAEFVAQEPSESLHVSELRHPLGRSRDAKRAARMEARRLAGLGRQHVPVQTY